MWNKKQKANLIEKKKKAVIAAQKELTKAYKNEHIDAQTTSQFAFWYVEIVPIVDIPGLEAAYKMLWPGLKSATKDFKQCETTMCSPSFMPDADWFTDKKLDLDKINYTNFYFTPSKHYDVEEFFKLPNEIQTLFGVDENYRKWWRSLTPEQRAEKSQAHSSTEDIFTLQKYLHCFSFKIVKRMKTIITDVNPESMSTQKVLEKKLYQDGEWRYTDDHRSYRWQKVEQHKKDRVALRSDIKKAYTEIED